MSKLRVILFPVMIALSGCASVWDFLLLFDYGNCESRHPYATVVEYSDKYAGENSKNGTKEGEMYWKEEKRFYSDVASNECSNKAKQ